ncbi:FAD-dependent oxidoreductase [Roseateles oligotrophus]|uniref:FAD-dependent oxidoreductase n=1 Tax=Roseateles oligotrophus TaxID=1769250 RepID=A0ABT2YH42_9BURK|nr:FAD-dependent oxidoreductase [Roseateles oligotrophus]MCV2369367.1 FAD-dependent oxidoreductase [Roseateles oligotrophus]
MKKQLLLVGAGHAHAQVLLDWLHAPLADTELTLVSPTALAPYSGMVPGWLAGTYSFDEICIDFAALAAAAGARFILGHAANLATQDKLLILLDGTQLHYDLLSLNIGSTLTPPALPATCRLLSLRPLGELQQSWESLLADPQLMSGHKPLRITALGGGAAGVEALLATVARLRKLVGPHRALQPQLLTRGDRLLPGMAPAAARAAAQALHAAGVSIQLGRSFDAELAQDCDLLLWATGAKAHSWPATSGLAVTGEGFIRVDEQLRSVSHPQVFAVGDCAEWSSPLPKAGVFAVRMGPVLSRNLRAALDPGSPAATNYKPQRRYLALLATADGGAIASWGSWSLRGRWIARALWRWKDHIDRSFLRRFQLSASPFNSQPSFKRP